MDETKRIVVEHFPVDRLPDELREPFTNGETVTVTVAAEPLSQVPRQLPDFVGAGKGLFRSPEDVLRSLRDGRDAV